jgi:hypothetical protein
MSKNINVTFLQRVLAGEASLNQIDDYVDQWHDSSTETRALPEFLGLTREEYSRWVLEADALSWIVKSHSVRDQKLQQFLKLRRQLTLEKEQLTERLAQINAALGEFSTANREDNGQNSPKQKNGFASRFLPKNGRELVEA